jgi:hypothetical protein
MVATKKFIALALCLILAACASTPPGDAFNKQLQAEVGKSIRDPSAMRNLYLSRLVRKKVLDNGNVEEEFFPGDKCTFYFEIDQKTFKIVAARLDKFERYCIAQ